VQHGQEELTSPLSYAVFRGRSRMPALDGVRACAILGVLLHHTRHDPFGRLHGFRGVWLFFVLSGFLITTLALREEDKTGALNVRAFAIRRVFRIMPLFYLALLAYVIWVCLFGMEQNQALLQQHLLSYLLYCPEFPIFHHQFRMPFAQAWSLGIEEKFYLLWPLLAFVCLARSKHRIGVTLILLACTAYLTATTGLAQMWGSYTDILIGCLLALVMNERKAYEQLRILGRPELTWAVLALLVAVALNRLTGTQLGERLFSLVGAAAIAALVTNTGAPMRLVSHPWLVRIGAWSYAIYLTHPIVFDVWNRLLPPGRPFDYVSLPLTIATDFPLCWLLHTWFEKPLIAVGRRLAGRTQQSEPPVPYERDPA
jgi:peptidoglycan/LPS O-acetylase OafA/YrhL